MEDFIMLRKFLFTFIAVLILTAGTADHTAAPVTVLWVSPLLSGVYFLQQNPLICKEQHKGTHRHSGYKLCVLPVHIFWLAAHCLHCKQLAEVQRRKEIADKGAAEHKECINCKLCCAKTEGSNHRHNNADCRVA